MNRSDEPIYLPDEVENARLLALDELVYGISFVDVFGARIDPSTLDLPAQADPPIPPKPNK